MTHHSYIGWVQVGGAWALYVLHFHVYPWLVCCSCVCHDMRACLHVLLLVLDLLWCGWVSKLSFFISYFFPRLGLTWSWAFPSSIHSLPYLWVGWHSCHAISLFLPCHPIVPAMLLFGLCLLGLFWACYILSFCSIPIVSIIIGLVLMLFWAFLAHFIAFELPWPILFFWASSVRFISLGIIRPFHFIGYPWPILVLHSHGFLLNLLSFPTQIIISFTFEVYGLFHQPLVT